MSSNTIYCKITTKYHVQFSKWSHQVPTTLRTTTHKSKMCHKKEKMQVAISLDNLNLRNKRIMFTMQQQRGTLLQILPSCNDNNLSAPAASLTNPCSPIFITLHLSFIVGASFITSATGEGSERISLCNMQSFQAQMTKR